MRPELLRADNFTPPTRTPWGGRKILRNYKQGLGLQVESEIVGESWEISVEPDFPSRLAADNRPLAEAIAADPVAWLGASVSERYGGQTPLLVKFLDSGDELSVQVHPEDGDPALANDESGKPESWLVLEAEPDCGLYLGFRDGVSRDDVERCLREAGPLDELLNFVPVAPGDTFNIAAGTAHAIGRGVTLVEPQFVAPGRRGLTYRYWDWNRRYDANGKLDSAGKPRDLHVERSLEVTDWEGAQGDAFIAECRAQPVPIVEGDVSRSTLVDWPWYVVEEWRGSGTLTIPAPDTLWGVVCLSGEATLAAGDGDIVLPAGQSAVVPAAAGDLTVNATDARLIATRSPVS